MTKLFTYSDGSFRVVATSHNFTDNFLKKLNINTDELDESITSSEEIDRISISRSKRVIREYVLCNNFTHFVTLTVSPDICDRYDIDICENTLRKLLKKYKRNNPNFIYLLIAEKHKKGGFHFHGFFGGLNPKDLIPFKLTDTIPLKIRYYLEHNKSIFYMKLFDDNLGFCTLSPILHKQKCSNYCLKYITKDCCRNSNGSLYICSRGLSRATSTYIRSFDFVDFMNFADKSNSFYNYHVNNFVKTLDFHPDDLPNCLKSSFEKYITDFNDNDFISFLQRFKRLQKRKENKNLINF